MSDVLEPRKATHEHLRRHNRQLLLRAVYSGQADSRAALAQATGLTKPTVSNLVAELLEEGLIEEGGRGPSSESGGKRPRLVAFRPRARQVIGVAVDRGGVHGVLADLAGTPSARHRAPLDAAHPLDALVGVVDGLRAQLDAPLLCIGVGVPGEVDEGVGAVRAASEFGWRDLAVAPPLAERYGVPVHLAHGTELCALAQYAFGHGRNGGPRRLVTLQVDRGIEFGVTLEGGAVHYGGGLAGMVPAVFAGEGEDGEAPDYLALRHAAAHGDGEARRRIEALAQRLAPAVGWILTLLRPDRLTIAGPVVDLGEPFLHALRHAVDDGLPGGLDDVALSLAYASRLGPAGAVALALQKELAIV